MLLSLAICLFLGVPVLNVDLPPIFLKILDDVSWNLKLKLLKDYPGTNTTTSTTTKRLRRVGMESLIMVEPQLDNTVQNRRTNEKSIHTLNGFDDKGSKEPKSIYRNAEISAENQKSKYLEVNPYRRFRNKVTVTQREGYSGFNNKDSSEDLRVRRQDSPPSSPSVDEENDMRMKLFRLMYETVRDSDLKVRRAELIKTHYHNYTSFDIGYLMGDITDKYNVMQDVAKTLERLYVDWKPLEHINAYEQIANQAIEISHLIDMMRQISKKNSTF